MSSIRHLFASLLLASAVSTPCAQGQPTAAAIAPSIAQAASTPSTPELAWLKEAIVSEVAKSAREASKEKNWNDPVVLIAAGAVLLTLASLAFSFYQFQQNRADMLEWKKRDSHANRQAILLESLKWFEGGIQTRAVGIAVIEGHWLDHPELRPTWASVLVAQAVYVLSKPERALPEHETRNLEKILALLQRAKAGIAAEVLGTDFFDPINDVLAKLPTKMTKTKEGKEFSPEDRTAFMEQVRYAVAPHTKLFKVPDALKRQDNVS